MGAAFNSRVFETNDRRRIAREWNDMVDESLREDGNSYSGQIGMLGRGVSSWVDSQFGSYDAAHEHLATHHQAWAGAMAVSFLSVTGGIHWLVGGWCPS